MPKADKKTTRIHEPPVVPETVQPIQTSDKDDVTPCGSSLAPNATTAADTLPTQERTATSPSVKVRPQDVEKYNRLKQYVLTENQLTYNEFPRPGQTPGAVVVKKPLSCSGPNKKCDNCERIFYLPSIDTYPADTCVYHSSRYANKIHFDTGNHFSRKKYPCCLGNEGCRGCQQNSRHTYSTNLYDTEDGGFVVAKPCVTKPDGGYFGVYAIDCEMVSTMGGRELARVTLINLDKEVIYESMVKPTHPVISYNTKFSGLTERDFVGVTTTLADVKEELMNILNSKSIIIGHGVNKDLLCLKFMHDVIIDTSVVFPHNKGPPYKKALKTIARDFLGRSIQDGTHCSEEDAVTCMDIMLKKTQQRFF